MLEYVYGSRPGSMIHSQENFEFTSSEHKNNTLVIYRTLPLKRPPVLIATINLD